MNERIQLILKTKNISASKFADEIGVQRSSISHIVSGRNNPSLDFIQKIIKRFPDINSDWIIFGKGSMYKEPDLFTTSEENKTETAGHNDEIQDSQDDIDVWKIAEVAKNEEKLNELTRNELKNLSSGKNKNATTINKEVTKPIRSETHSKIIERIIIFYSDKTCTEYKVNP
jgi:transcriptional regulator with XRE-family HTH domain